MNSLKMRALLCTLLMVNFALIKAQAPQKMSYQAVIRNASSNLVLNTAIGMQISIIQGNASGTSVYVETHKPTSNANGLITIEIGTGTVITGNFSTINWAAGPYFIRTESDPTGGTNYSIVGISQLLSVPYALFAANAINYSPGSGISINNGTIANISPNQLVNIAATGISSILGAYPNYTINTPSNIAGTGISINGNTITNTVPNQTVNVAATGISSVSGTYPNYTVNTPNHIGGTGISVNGNTIINTAPNQTVNIAASGISSVSGAYPNYTVNTPSNIAGSGIAVNGNTIINTAPNQTVNIAASGISSISGAYPNFTLNTPNHLGGTGISVNGNTIINTAPNQTVNIAASGISSVSGAYPNYTVNASIVAGNGISVSGNTISLAPSTLSIGSNFGGGIVFYIDPSGFHGLITSSVDLGTGNYSSIAFGNISINTTFDCYLCGQINSKLANLNYGTNSNMFYSVSMYNGGGYTDWYIPSRYELSLIYFNLKVPNICSFSNAWYWSSTEFYNISGAAWSMNFSNGALGGNSKVGAPSVYYRAIRAF